MRGNLCLNKLTNVFRPAPIVPVAAGRLIKLLVAVNGGQLVQDGNLL